MNNDQIKNILLKLKPNTEEFTVTMTGKSSKKVNGLYKPATREILLHNRNFSDDNDLLHTAIHEFAHHLHFCSHRSPTSHKCHTTEFRNIFHSLLNEAEKQGLYKNIFRTEKEFIELTEDIRVTYLGQNSQLMVAFGRRLHDAYELCQKYNVRFQDYVERELLITPAHARALFSLPTTGHGIPREFGFENMKALAKLKKEEQAAAIEAINAGASIDMVKAEFSRSTKEERLTDPVEKLHFEKEKIKKQILRLESKLKRLEEQIKEGEESPEAAVVADTLNRLTIRLTDIKREEKSLVTAPQDDDSFIKFLAKWNRYLSGSAIKLLITIQYKGPALSLQDLEKKTGLKINTIKKAIAELKAENIIRVESSGKGRGRETLFFIV